MGLIIPQTGWSDCTTNLSGTPQGSLSPGTQLTNSGVANTDSAPFMLLSSLAHDVYYLEIGIMNGGVSGANSAALLDILIDPTGSGGSPDLWVTLINDLLAGGTQTISAFATFARYYRFPIFIPRGTAIGARFRSASTVNNPVLLINAFGGLSRPDTWWYGEKVTEIGVNSPSTSTCTLHTAGNTGAFSAWANLGSTLPQDAGAIQFGIGTGNGTALNLLEYYFQFAAVSSVSPDVQAQIGPTQFATTQTTETINTLDTGPIFCDLPKGTQLQVRGTCSGTAQALDVAAYAVS